MRYQLIQILTCLVFILSQVVGFTQVVINEFCVANYSDFNPGDNEDWIEFYNTGASNENIGGYWLSDDPANPMKWQFPANTIINPGGRLVVLLSGAGNYNPNMFGYLNTQYRVTQTDGESIIFSSTTGTVIESYNLSVLGSFQANHSY
ncbi:MAG: lamin tail domain-containing protein, partial [Flavobacteriales bacterium]